MRAQRASDLHRPSRTRVERPPVRSHASSSVPKQKPRHAAAHERNPNTPRAPFPLHTDPSPRSGAAAGIRRRSPERPAAPDLLRRLPRRSRGGLPWCGAPPAPRRGLFFFGAAARERSSLFLAHGFALNLSSNSIYVRSRSRFGLYLAKIRMKSASFYDPRSYNRAPRAWIYV